MNSTYEIFEAKRSLRKEKIRWRSTMPAEEARAKSEQIAARIKTLTQYANAKTVLFYVSAKSNEVDTRALMREALAGSVRVLVPVTDFERKMLIISEIKSMQELVPARFGLLEPEPNSLRPVSVTEAEVVIVPGVAFDHECRRIGFGGGYYDRLLSDTDITSIALCYDGQIVSRVPTDFNDMPVDILVTESHIYHCS
jgi:5-formyltetrahydrofolate cyclo-ligase